MDDKVKEHEMFKRELFKELSSKIAHDLTPEDHAKYKKRVYALLEGM